MDKVLEVQEEALRLIQISKESLRNARGNNTR